jgi:hypothetical protein
MSAGLRTPRGPRLRTWVHIVFLLTSRWLSSFWMVRMSCPRSSRCVANEYRDGGGPGCRIPCHASGAAGGISITSPIRVQHSDTCETVRRASVHGLSQPFVEGRPNSGLEPIQRCGHHPMVRQALGARQQCCSFGTGACTTQALSHTLKIRISCC